MTKTDLEKRFESCYILYEQLEALKKLHSTWERLVIHFRGSFCEHCRRVFMMVYNYK